MDHSPPTEAKRARKSGRHVDAELVVVRLTQDAMDDLRTLMRKGDPQVVKWVLKKCLMLERDPKAGEELLGGLIGYRKLVVGNRDWRVVWRVTHDEIGRTIVDVAEVWAVGARSDSEIYNEMSQRIAALKGKPATVSLAEALESLGRVSRGLSATDEPSADQSQDEVPPWLTGVLTNVLGMPHNQVNTLTLQQAHEIWESYKSQPRQ